MGLLDDVQAGRRREAEGRATEFAIVTRAATLGWQYFPPNGRHFTAYFYCTGELALGIEVWLRVPRIIVRLPGGLFSLGWMRGRPLPREYEHRFLYRTWGYNGGE